MTRNVDRRPRFRSLHIYPRSKRGWCFCASSVYAVTVIIWMFSSTADALANMTDTQCQMMLLEFGKTFVKPGDGYPTIKTCDTRIMGLLWDQQITRLYSTGKNTIGVWLRCKNKCIV